jgi:hypothetical protein
VNFLISLEESAIGVWTSTSLVGYPLMITLHAIGMAIMVGLSVTLDLRMLGWFRGMPYTALNRFLGIAWAGFTINLLSGTALFTMQASSYVQDITFLLKMFFVLAGVVVAAFLQGALNRGSASWSGTAAPGGIRFLAIVSIGCWVAATVTGRLIAYLV